MLVLVLVLVLVVLVGAYGRAGFLRRGRERGADVVQAAACCVWAVRAPAVRPRCGLPAATSAAARCYHLAIPRLQLTPLPVLRSF